MDYVIALPLDFVDPSRLRELRIDQGVMAMFNLLSLRRLIVRAAVLESFKYSCEEIGDDLIGSMSQQHDPPYAVCSTMHTLTLHVADMGALQLIIYAPNVRHLTLETLGSFGPDRLAPNLMDLDAYVRGFEHLESLSLEKWFEAWDPIKGSANVGSWFSTSQHLVSVLLPLVEFMRHDSTIFASRSLPDLRCLILYYIEAVNDLIIQEEAFVWDGSGKIC